ncbi:unnamed protein product [Choristocarpus tenellus]
MMGRNHTVVITVEHLQPKCLKDQVPCIADGALSVIVDGDKAGLGKVSLGGGVGVTAVNLPGECRPFWFEQYWLEKTKLSEQIGVDQSRRLVSDVPTEDWIMNETKQTLLNGILGETVHPTVNEMGEFIMTGPGAIRGEEEDYVVAGPLAMGFILHL